MPFEDFQTIEITYFGAIVSCKSSRHTVKEGYKRKMKDVKARLHTTIQGIRIFMYVHSGHFAEHVVVRPAVGLVDVGARAAVGPHEVAVVGAGRVGVPPVGGDDVGGDGGAVGEVQGGPGHLGAVHAQPEHPEVCFKGGNAQSSRTV